MQGKVNHEQHEFADSCSDVVKMILQSIMHVSLCHIGGKYSKSVPLDVILASCKESPFFPLSLSSLLPYFPFSHPANCKYLLGVVIWKSKYVGFIHKDIESKNNSHAK